MFAMSLEALDTLLESLATHRDVFVVLDGYDKADDGSGVCERVWRKLTSWQRCDPCHRRFVCVTSMESIRYNYSKYAKLKTLPTKPSRQNGKLPLFEAMEFELSSWTLDEYLAAVENEAFFRSVMDAFGLKTDPGIVERMKIVKEKYCVAGGSATAMFSLNLATAQANLMTAIKHVNNPQGYVDCSSSGMSQLIAHYDVGKSDAAEFRGTIVSVFASRQLALQLVPTALINFVQCINGDPFTDEHLFGAWVVASLAYSGLEYRFLDEPNAPLRLERCPVTSFDPTNDVITNVNRYFLPTKWNQAGYDAVYIVLDKGTSRLRYIFLHITRAAEHHFVPEPFVEVLQRLGQHDKQNVGAVELRCVVPRVILKQFAREVDDLSFRKHVLDIVFPGSNRRSANVKTRVAIVGVDYPFRYREP